MYQTSNNYKQFIYADSTKHLLNIFIDEKQVNPDHILDFKVSHTLFSNDEFTLGGVTAKTIEMRIYKDSLSDTYDTFYAETGINNEIVPIGYFVLDSIEKNDDDTITLKAIDFMVKFEFNYDGSSLNYPTTILEVLQDICLKAEVELGSTSFLNNDQPIVVYDNTISAREYLSYIAEQAGGFACIGRDGKLYIRTIGQDTAEINIELFQDYTWGEAFQVSRVAYEDGIQDLKFGNDTYNTIWINSDNMYIVESNQIENIYHQLKDFECYSFEGTTIIDPALDIGDILLIDNKKVVYQGDMEYVGKFKASISSKIQAKSKEETTRTIVSDKTKIRRVQSQIDQVEGKITQLVQETGEYDEKISKVEQDINGVKQTVENMEDFTREKIQVENLYVGDIAEGEGYVLNFKIYGDTNYFNKKEITICASTQPRGYGESIYISTEKGEDLLTEDGQELIVGSTSYYIDTKKIMLNAVLRSLKIEEKIYYDILEILQDGTIQVIRKIGVDSKDNYYLLANEEIEIIEEKFILPSIKDGIYYFIEECSNLKYSINYITENDYSKTFLTKLELGTKIEQNAEAVKIAWNQISEFIQLMVLNNNASFAILDKDKNVMMSLDKQGQHFYKDGKDVFGEMGIQKIDKERFISFSVEGEYDKQIENGMAWGIKTKNDEKFHPILSIKNFAMGPENSDASYGELELSSCNLVLNGFGTGIKTGGVLINGDPSEQEGVFFWDINNNKNLLSINPGNSTNSTSIAILDNMNFYRNRAGSNSFRIGSGDEFCIFTDEGYISCNDIYLRGKITTSGKAYIYGGADIGFSGGNYQGATIYGNLSVRGSVYADDFVSDERVKKNIKDSKTSALDIIKQIRHRQFELKKNGIHYDIGYVAQEIKKIAPNFVLKREEKGELEERYYMNLLPILATATKAIQEQQEQIERLLKRIEKLEEEK